MRTRSKPSSQLVTAALLLIVVGAGCGDDSSDDASVGDDAAPVAPVAPALAVGEVHSFDLADMEGCDPDDDVPDKTVCLHVDQEVRYEHMPPVGGMHSPIPQNCIFYDEPIFNEGAVHSLEHGAVWITYDPDLPEDQVDHLRLLAEHPKVLASPWDLSPLDAPVVLSAWGFQLPLSEVPSDAATQFVNDHAGGPTAPKPDAPCDQGYAGTRANP